MPFRRGLVHSLEFWAITAITLLAAFLRFDTLGDKSLHGDEMNMVRFITGERDIRLNFGNAHFYIQILRVTHWFGDSDFVMRVPAALAGVVAVPVLYYVGKQLLDARVGLTAALFLALSPIHIDLSQMVHCYSLFFLFALLSFYYLYRAHTESSSRHWMAYALVTGLCMNTHLFTVFMIGAQVLILMILWGHGWWQRRRSDGEDGANAPSLPRPWLHVAGVTAVILLFSMQVILGTIAPMLGEVSKKVSGEGTEVNQLESGRQFVWSVATFAKIPRAMVRWESLETRSVPIAYLLFAIGTVWLLRRRWILGVMTLVWVFAPPIPIAIFTELTTIDFGARRFIFLWPVCLLAIAVGMSKVTDALLRFVPLGRQRTVDWRRPVLQSVLPLVLAGLFSMTVVKDYFLFYERPDFKFAADLIDRRANPQDFILTFKPEQLYYYLPKDRKAHTVNTMSLETIRTLFRKGQGIWYLRYNSLRHRPHYEEIEKWLTEIGATTIQVGGGMALSFHRHPAALPKAPFRAKQELYRERVEVLSAAIILKPNRWYLHHALGGVYDAWDRRASAREREYKRSRELRQR